jgi:phage terminase small subunit
MSEKLTTKQRLFVEAYLGSANSNGTEAARMAGYKGNDKTLSVVGAENLAKPCIAALIEKKVESFGMTAKDVLKELADIAGANWREFVDIQYDKDGEQLKAVLKLNDKLKALELLGKHFKLFTDKTEIDIKNVSDLPDEELLAIANSKG